MARACTRRRTHAVGAGHAARHAGGMCAGGLQGHKLLGHQALCSAGGRGLPLPGAAGAGQGQRGRAASLGPGVPGSGASLGHARGQAGSGLPGPCPLCGRWAETQPRRGPCARPPAWPSISGGAGRRAAGGGSYHGADAVRGGRADGVVVRVRGRVHSAVAGNKAGGKVRRWGAEAAGEATPPSSLSPPGMGAMPSPWPGGVAGTS